MTRYDSRPLLLDGFCSAGGAAMGYRRAGFNVLGVDIKPQPRYPFDFVQADFFTYIKSFGHLFDAIHASPHCQPHSRTKTMHSRSYDIQLPKLIKVLDQIGKPYVIENVPGAPMRKDLSLSGKMFGLPIVRYRWFHSNVLLFEPQQIRYPAGVMASSNLVTVAGNGSKGDTLVRWSQAMGINWMVRRELAQAVPPAYTHWIGTQLLSYLHTRSEVI